MSDQKQEPAAADEEISLGGGSGSRQQSPTQPGEQKQQTPPDEDAAQNMGARHGALEQLTGPSVSDLELVDAVVRAPIEQLIPWEYCRLPSRGLYYNWSTEGCEVRGMGQAADKVLANQRLAQTGESIDHLFRECVRLPNGMEPLDLLVGDRVFLLYYLRGITHGNIYEFAVTCRRPDCNQVSTHVFDLNQLSSTLHYADPTLGQEPFKVVLPYLSESLKRDFYVGVRFLRGRDTGTMLAMRKVRKKMHAAPTVRVGGKQRPQRQTDQSIDDTLSENLQLVIQSVMGIEDRQRINLLVNKLHSTDTAAIREWLRDNSPGIDTTIDLKCPECGQEFVVELPITESFFRPTQTR